MITSERVLLRDEIRMEELLRCLREGGVMIYPTETIYSLGGALSSTKATQSVFNLKRRNVHEALNSIVYDLRQAEGFANIRFDLEARLLMEFGQRGLTVVLNAHPWVATEPRGGGPTLGVRLATTELTRFLTQRVAEPLTNISAGYSLVRDADNSTIVQYPSSIYDISSDILDHVDYVIEAEQKPTGLPSTMVRVVSEDRIVLLREGVLDKREIAQLGITIEPSEAAG